MIQALQSLDWMPLWISLKTGIVATVVCFFLGIIVAWWTMKTTSKVRSIIDGLLTLPLVLPPTVAGFFLLLLFSTRRPVGSFLFNTMNIKIIQTWLGCLVAAVVIAFPLMYKSARAVFEQMDINLVYAGRTLGLSEFTIFRKIVLPNARSGLASGTILTFARAMGEYGATSMIAGNVAGKTATISQEIAMVLQDGDYMKAGAWSLVILVIAFVIIVSLNLVLGKKNKRRW